MPLRDAEGHTLFILFLANSASRGYCDQGISELNEHACKQSQFLYRQIASQSVSQSRQRGGYLQSVQKITLYSICARAIFGYKYRAVYARYNGSSASAV